MRSKFNGLQRWLAANWNGLLAATLIITGLAAIWFWSKPIGEHFSLPKSGRLDIVRVYLLAAGGGLLLWQIFIANRRASAAERTAELTALSNITERLNSAIEHLGSEDSIVRIGGIYQLHHIARDAPDYRSTVFALVRSHLDLITPDLDGESETNDQTSIELDIMTKMLYQRIAAGGVYYEEDAEDGGRP